MLIFFEVGNGDDGVVWKDLLELIYIKMGVILIIYDWVGLGRSGIDIFVIGFMFEVEQLESVLK